MKNIKKSKLFISSSMVASGHGCGKFFLLSYYVIEQFCSFTIELILFDFFVTRACHEEIVAVAVR